MSLKIRISAMLVALVFAASGCVDMGSVDESVSSTKQAAKVKKKKVKIHQFLTNGPPSPPGTPGFHARCPTGPTFWLSGGGTSTATSKPFGDMTETETYCIDTSNLQLHAGEATWVDSDGDTISMRFQALLLTGPEYTPPPSAPIVGQALFTAGTGKWAGISGDAVITGHQNGDGTSDIFYKGRVYIPKN